MVPSSTALLVTVPVRVYASGGGGTKAHASMSNASPLRARPLKDSVSTLTSLVSASAAKRSSDTSSPPLIVRDAGALHGHPVHRLDVHIELGGLREGEAVGLRLDRGNLGINRCEDRRDFGIHV